MLNDLFSDIFAADPVPTFLVWGPWAWGLSDKRCVGPGGSHQ